MRKQNILRINVRLGDMFCCLAWVCYMFMNQNRRVVHGVLPNNTYLRKC